jgi:hypothetical protein
MSGGRTPQLIILPAPCSEDGSHSPCFCRPHRAELEASQPESVVRLNPATTVSEVLGLVSPESVQVAAPFAAAFLTQLPQTSLFVSWSMAAV